MQRDDHLTFGEIHDSVDALAVSVEDIIQRSCVAVPEQKPLKLRFLTPAASVEDWIRDEQICDYKLTTLDQHDPGLEYVTVSYCWEHNQSRDELPQIPEYRIQDLGHPSRPPRRNACSDIIFYRAMRFDRHHGCAYVWIDQECIDQDSIEDVERHLQIMPRVYYESRLTVALLAICLKESLTLSGLGVDYPHRLDPCSGDDLWDGLNVIWAVRFITQDRWFTRTWTLLEKSFARALYWSIPIDHELPEFEILRMRKSGDTVFVEHDLFVARTKLQNSLQQFGVRKGHRKYEVDERLQKIRPKWNVLDVIPELLPYVAEGHPISLRKRKRTFFPDMVYSIENSENKIVSDRIAILGNMCNLPYHLQVDMLDHNKDSYSTCLLALFMANQFSTAQRRQTFFVSHGSELMQNVVSHSIISRFGPGRIALESFHREFRETHCGSYLERFLFALGIDPGEAYNLDFYSNNVQTQSLTAIHAVRHT